LTHNLPQALPKTSLRQKNAAKVQQFTRADMMYSCENAENKGVWSNNVTVGLQLSTPNYP
jgi:hypothetical protein